MKVRIWCCTHDVQSEVEEVFDMPDDVTAKDLTEEAAQFYENEKQPEWGYEILDGDRKGEVG